jgi:hypothetical protein
MSVGPRGWTPLQTDTRFIDGKPSSYDSRTHTARCVIATDTSVRLAFGTEVLRITKDSVDLSRMENGSMIPLLDSHQANSINNALGRFLEVWIERGTLMGEILFNRTPAGELAEGMVQRNEVSGISCGYAVRSWEISDQDGNILDPDRNQLRWDDNLTYTATRWVLHEASLVSVPADYLSGVRSFSNTDHDPDLINRRARMRARQAISDRMSRQTDELL